VGDSRDLRGSGISGAKGSDQRPAFDTTGLVAAVLHVVNALAELDAAGVALYSDQQAIDSTTPSGRTIIQMASSIRARRPIACRSMARFPPENSAPAWIEVGTGWHARLAALHQSCSDKGLSCGRRGTSTHDGRRDYEYARTECRAGRPPVTARLHTGRLALRRWEDADRDPYAELASDAVVMQYLTPLGVRETSDAWIDRQNSRCAAFSIACHARIGRGNHGVTIYRGVCHRHSKG
jgi:hypothetical protein